MKILQVNNVYGEQSTGKLTQHLHEGLLARGHESLVVFGRGHAAASDKVIRLCPEWYGKANSLLSKIVGMPYGGCHLSTARLKGIIRRERPDVVHLQCINGNFVNIYRLICWLKKQKIRTVVSLHAEFMYTANCGYAFDCDQWKGGCKNCPNPRKASHSWFFDRTGRSWQRMRAAFDGFNRDCVLCPVSPWTAERAAQADIMKGIRSVTVLNGVDRTFRYRPCQKEEQILHVTSQFCDEPNHIKGGWYLIELARRMPQVRFLVAGSAAPIENLPGNVTLLGQIRDQKALAELYQTSKLSLLVSQRETFSMPCAESLCCGTPVVGFKAGAPEQISLPAYSEFVEHGDLDGLEATLRRWLAAEHDPLRISAMAQSTYSLDTMIQGFLEVYECLIDSEK